jgi:hypothetical protein
MGRLEDWIDNRFDCLLFIVFIERLLGLADSTVFLEILVMGFLSISRRLKGRWKWVEVSMMWDCA